ncbi:tyrosine-type recombinase/integrase [Aestuariivirga sp.]|uniref:tyrosine-type recombinase/integrase n=1 Tax=Aestuariivirga sp. TaxID=2650926 RepID=UPI0039E49446
MTNLWQSCASTSKKDINMIGQPAKVLAPADVRALLHKASQGRYPQRNKVMVLLSVKAGLRACEISRLTWSMVLDSQGKVAEVLELPARAAKKGSGRRVPLHPDLKKALEVLLKTSSVDGPVVLSERRKPMSAKVVVNWFKLQFRALGLEGCSSHSGRRTFVTLAARLVHKAGGSLRDVQELVGHRSIKTTQSYIEGSSDAQRRLIRAL